MFRSRSRLSFRFLAALLALALVALTGCRRPPEEDAKRIQFAFWGSVQQQRAEEELIDRFHEAHPEIEVDVMVIGSRYAEVIQAMIIGGVAPDVFMVNLINYDEWSSRGVLEDLTGKFLSVDEEAEVLPIPRRAVERDGRFFGIPINAHGMVTFYNRDALDAAGIELPPEGINWEFLEEMAPRLSRRAGRTDAPTDFLMLMPPPPILFWQHGVEFFDDLTHPTEVTVNVPEAIEAIGLLRRFRESGYSVPPDIASDEGTYQLFRDGRVAFYFNGRWMTPEFAGRTDFDWDIRPFPGGPVSNITQHGGTVLAIWKDSPRKEAARKFLRFYASERGARISMQWQRNVPIFDELAYGDDFLDLRPPESMVHFSDTMQEGASQYNLYAPGGQEVTRIFYNHIERALADPDIPAEEILAGMEYDLERWLQRMQRRGIFESPAETPAGG